MSDFWINFTLGLKHMLQLVEHNDILFLLVLMIPFEKKAWKKIVILISLFISCHTFSLLLTVFNILTLKINIIVFIISLLILIIALYNLLFYERATKNNSLTFVAVVTSIFGIFHGLGFANYFNSHFTGKPTDKLLPLFESSLGFGFSQIIFVAAILLIAHIIQTSLKFSKRDWILIVSAFVVGVIIPIIIKSKIWIK